jgi:hypothetical protein
MNHHVHQRLTGRWAIEEGFGPEVADKLGRLTRGVDRLHPGHALLPGNRRYHFARYGAFGTADAALQRALRTGSLLALATALHALQDAIGHGDVGPVSHHRYPDIDLWERREPEVRARIEAASRAALAAYVAAWPQRAAGEPGEDA